MHRLIKHLPVLGLVAGLAASGPRVAAAQETQTGDSTVQAAPGDSGEVQTPPGYRGMERPATAADSTLPDSLAGDSLGQGDTTRATGTPRLNPTDSTGAAPGAGDSASAGRDSAGVLPGDSTSIRPGSPSDRLEPADSAGTMGP